jgi:signal transduction histidine kinase
MDTHRVDPAQGRRHGFWAARALGAAGLSLRLAVLRQHIERHYAMALGLDLVNRDAIDRLPPDLGDALAALIEEAATNAALHAGAAMTRVHLQVNGGIVLLTIDDDGRGFPFIGIYDLPALAALDVGPRQLMERVAALGGSLTLISRVSGARIEIVLPNGAKAKGAVGATLHSPRSRIAAA